VFRDTMHLRDLTDLPDLARVVELERVIWGYVNGDDLTPLPLLAATVRRGAILVGAFDEAGNMAGFVYSLPAVHRGRLSQWSHMLGVVPGRRQRGVGRALKLAQRERALAMGADLVEWTFDPLQVVNAHFNFARLGVVAEEYEANIYGMSVSPLHGNVPTDRLIAQWWVRDDRVERCARGEVAAMVHTGLPAVNEVARSGPWLACGAVDLSLDLEQMLVRIPVGFTAMLGEEPALAQAWRAATREIFATYLARGYRATDFVLEAEARYGSYVLTAST
jgi:predicted GNAT superfamily acetyltransferase